MKSLARWFVAEIRKQIEQSASNKVLICLNCIDNAEIYCDICSTLQNYADKNDIQMTAKLAKKNTMNLITNPQINHMHKRYRIMGGSILRIK